MLPSVWRRTARDSARSLLVWSLALVGLVGVYVAIYPSVKGNQSFTKLIDQLPSAYRTLFRGGGGDFSSPAGYLDTEFLTFMGPLLVLVYAIGFGSGALAGEEERGIFEMVFANPVSRTSFVLGKFASMLSALFVLMVALFLAIVGLGRPAGMAISPWHVGAAVTHLGLLGAEFGALSLVIGALTGRVVWSRAVPAALAIVAWLTNGLAGLASWLGPVRRFSPFYQYIGHDPIRLGLSIDALLISAASGLVLVGLSLYLFQQRDIRGV